MTSVSVLDGFYEDIDLDHSYSSDDDSDSPPRKKRRPNRIWTEQKMFETGVEAQLAVTLENIWKEAASSKSNTGVRVEYQCTAMKYRRNACPASIYLMYHATSSKVSLHKTDCAHANHVSYPTLRTAGMRNIKQ